MLLAARTTEHYVLVTGWKRAYNVASLERSHSTGGDRLDAKALMAWAKIILSGAITAMLVPLAVYFSRYYWDRRRWHTFEGLIRSWAQAEFALDDLREGLEGIGRDKVERSGI